jgi:hypothetical protein
MYGDINDLQPLTQQRARGGGASPARQNSVAHFFPFKKMHHDDNKLTTSDSACF